MALGSALCAACATLLIQRGLQRSNFYAGAWINVVVGAVAAWSATLLIVPWHAYTWRAVPYFVFSGVVGTAGGPALPGARHPEGRRAGRGRGQQPGPARGHWPRHPAAGRARRAA